MVPQYKRFLEGHAKALRDKCAVPPFGRLDPFELAKKMEMDVLLIHRNLPVPAEILEQLLDRDSSSWSGGTLHLPDGKILVVMNSTHDIRRQRATLMEEIAHVHLKHTPSKLQIIDGVVLRSWDQTVENQAYWLGATALVPERVLKGARTLRKTVQDVATDCGVSEQLVTFRMKISGISLAC